MTLVGKPAPDFTETAVVGDDFVQYTLSSNWTGAKRNYTLLFFYPGDFTFVCPTEIIAFSDRIAEFEKRNVQVVGVSVDSKFSHLAWKKQPRSDGGIGEIQYPLISDLRKHVAAAYDVLAADGRAYRGLFLIDRKGEVRHALVNDQPIGRSVDEALRTIDALQFHEKHGEVCPADWKPGDMAIAEDTVKSKKFFAAKAANGAAKGRKAILSR